MTSPEFEEMEEEHGGSDDDCGGQFRPRTRAIRSDRARSCHSRAVSYSTGSRTSYSVQLRGTMHDSEARQRSLLNQ
eukprot:CAMPEP_0185857362 /NCGR_PEP_ID=MMETSP1354-20130828/29469_1 /TAXON_ID=708628 /ORGANISM="Erythrolobus madagascarensis, Strain CCMP3276" /LENGTH=75 /DNA_ID=CAMNT_0028559631 /DNA_START=722 /DNA_END=946 /DNA_ORIENTATION=+